MLRLIRPRPFSELPTSGKVLVGHVNSYGYSVIAMDVPFLRRELERNPNSYQGWSYTAYETTTSFEDPRLQSWES